MLYALSRGIKSLNIIHDDLNLAIIHFWHDQRKTSQTNVPVKPTAPLPMAGTHGMGRTVQQRRPYP